MLAQARICSLCSRPDYYNSGCRIRPDLAPRGLLLVAARLFPSGTDLFRGGRAHAGPSSNSDPERDRRNKSNRLTPTSPRKATEFRRIPRPRIARSGSSAKPMIPRPAIAAHSGALPHLVNCAHSAQYSRYGDTSKAVAKPHNSPLKGFAGRSAARTTSMREDDPGESYRGTGAKHLP